MNIMLDDKKVWRDGYKRLPQDCLKVPSLYMMGYAKNGKAWEPLATHYHETLEIVVMLNGSQRYYVGQNEYMLHGGNLFITYPYEEHGNGDQPQNACEFIWFQLDLTEREDFLGLSGPLSQQMFRWITQCRKRVMNVDPLDMKLLVKAWEGLSAGEENARLLGYSALLHFVSSYFYLSSDKKDTEHRMVTPDIQKSLQFIQEHLTQSVSIDEIAEESGLSPSRFKAKFREQVGVTPLYYMNSLKIDLAKEMLKNSGQSVIQIAFALDFASSNYFSAVFKKFTGYTPGEFRRLECHIRED